MPREGFLLPCSALQRILLPMWPRWQLPWTNVNTWPDPISHLLACISWKHDYISMFLQPEVSQNRLPCNKTSCHEKYKQETTTGLNQSKDIAIKVCYVKKESWTLQVTTSVPNVQGFKQPHTHTFSFETPVVFCGLTFKHHPCVFVVRKKSKFMTLAANKAINKKSRVKSPAISWKTENKKSHNFFFLLDQ